MGVHQANDDLRSIREIMERSVRFISLSGWAGVLAGSYALAGAAYAYNRLYLPGSLHLRSELISMSTLWELLFAAVIVLVLSVSTAILLTVRKAREQGVRYWNQAARDLLYQAGTPLVAGGLLTIALVWRGYWAVAAPSTLVFYGLALFSASRITWKEVRTLGLLEIILGLTGVMLPGYGLFFWAAGFGLLHILYGFFMYRKYER